MERTPNFLLLAIMIMLSFPLLGKAQDSLSPKPALRTIVAEILMVDRDFYVVRGDRGEIRIEVTPDTKLSEQFKFGDRIKAVVLPNDSAVSIERAGEGEALGISTQQPPPIESAPKSEVQETKAPVKSSRPAEPDHSVPPPALEPVNQNIRIVVAEILMVDGAFYVVRSERGEIRIEVTPDTKAEGKFKFGDRIKAHILANDKAISIQRASLDEPFGIVTATAPPRVVQEKPKVPLPESGVPDKPAPETTFVAKTPKTRTIVAEILMIDGNFYVVRGERGEIRIEVTSNTKLTEKFKFGDKIKARVLANDVALVIERAQPDEPVGITDPQ